MIETRDFILRPRYWALVASGVLVTAVAGPFHTLTEMELGPRVVYWGVIVVLSGFLLTTLSMIGLELAARYRVPWALPAALAGLLASGPIYALVWYAGVLMVGTGSPSGLPLVFEFIVLPTVVVNLVVNGFVANGRHEARAASFAPRFELADPETGVPETGLPLLPLAADPSVAPPLPSLFERLPADLGRDLVCLRAQDHYVEAITTRGRAMVLMRLSDAERELTPCDGMRVHRSWWVSLNHVRQVTRTEGGGMEVVTTTGETIPVARGQRTALRAALDDRRQAAE